MFSNYVIKYLLKTEKINLFDFGNGVLVLMV